MKIIIVEGKAWVQLRSSFADFIHRVEQLIGNPPQTEAWLDNEAVKTLNSYHSVKTAQRMIHQLEVYSEAIKTTSAGDTADNGF